MFFPGVLGIGRLAMQADSLIKHDDYFNFEASDIHMRYNSKILAKRITVIAGNIHMEGEATFDTTGTCILYLHIFDGLFYTRCWFIGL
jgi:hypothetical protein